VAGFIRDADAGEWLPGSPRETAPTWADRLSEYVLFLTSHGRAPSQHAEHAVERALFHWLRNQRTTLRNGVMLSARRAALDQSLPGWNMAAPGGDRRCARNQRVWDRWLEQLVLHVCQHDRNPVVSPGVYPEELKLGKWLALQRHLLREGTLKSGRESRLDEAAPGWRSPHGRHQSPAT
jgi:hypothetical protein